MAEKQIFEAVLEKHENMEATGITISFDVEKVFGAKRVPVKVQSTTRNTVRQSSERAENIVWGAESFSF